jgi:hypothetical protein
MADQFPMRGSVLQGGHPENAVLPMTVFAI